MWCLIRGVFTIAENYKKRGRGVELRNMQAWSAEQ